MKPHAVMVQAVQAQCMCMISEATRCDGASTMQASPRNEGVIVCEGVHAAPAAHVRQYLMSDSI